MPFRIRVTLIVLATLASAVLLLPLVWPVPPLTGVAPAREVAGEEATWIDAGALDLHARLAGPSSAGAGVANGVADGVGVGFLHGFGSNLESFARVQDALSDRAVTVAWDRPAFGLSERPLTWSGDNPYGPDAQVAHVLTALDAAGIDRAVLVGHSAGGAIAIQTALAHPARVAGLVLIAPAVYRGGGAPAWSRWALHTPQLERIGPLLMRQLGGEPGESLLRSSYADPERLRPEVLEAYRRATRVQDWDRGLWELVKASREPELADRLAEVDVPTLVVTGLQDTIVPPEQTVRLASELPDARLLEIDDCGHVPQEECATPVIEAIDAWWSERIAP
jgi:pimeloyl-ACP methyl ester carboxylesterase